MGKSCWEWHTPVIPVLGKSGLAGQSAWPISEPQVQRETPSKKKKKKKTRRGGDAEKRWLVGEEH